MKAPNIIFFLLPFLLLIYSFNGPPINTPKSHIVEIKDMKFQPAELVVNKGDTVIWINKDIVPHDVTEKNKAWASPLLNNEDVWKKVVKQSDAYYCSIHLVMKGKLIVKKN